MCLIDSICNHDDIISIRMPLGTLVEGLDGSHELQQRITEELLTGISVASFVKTSSFSTTFEKKASQRPWFPGNSMTLCQCSNRPCPSRCFSSLAPLSQSSIMICVAAMKEAIAMKVLLLKSFCVLNELKYSYTLASESGYPGLFGLRRHIGRVKTVFPT